MTDNNKLKFWSKGNAGECEKDLTQEPSFGTSSTKGLQLTSACIGNRLSFAIDKCMNKFHKRIEPSLLSELDCPLDRPWGAFSDSEENPAYGISCTEEFQLIAHGISNGHCTGSSRLKTKRTTIVFFWVKDNFFGLVDSREHYEAYGLKNKEISFEASRQNFSSCSRPPIDAVAEAAYQFYPRFSGKCDLFICGLMKDGCSCLIQVRFDYSKDKGAPRLMQDLNLAYTQREYAIVIGAGKEQANGAQVKVKIMRRDIAIKLLSLVAKVREHDLVMSCLEFHTKDCASRILGSGTANTDLFQRLMTCENSNMGTRSFIWQIQVKFLWKAELKRLDEFFDIPDEHSAQRQSAIVPPLTLLCKNDVAFLYNNNSSSADVASAYSRRKPGPEVRPKRRPPQAQNI
ncbi:hypothetical protein ACLB2K_075757 [Fragaria x ananassa]